MKTTKKVLSILLAALMIFSIIPMTAFAKDTTAEEFISNENLCVVAEDLLKNLGARINDTENNGIVGTVLRLVFKFVDIEQAEGKDLTALSQEELADILVAWLNANLPEWTESIPGWVSSITPLLGVKLNLKSVDGIMESLASIAGNKTVKNTAGGDAKLLTDAGLKKNGKVVAKKNGFTSIDIIKALFTWISDDGQISVIKEVLKGNLNLSKLIEGFVDLSDINNTMKNLPATIKGLIYEIAGYRDENGAWVSYEDSIYFKEGYTADEMLACALIALLKDGPVAKADAQKAAGLTFYQLLGEYADDAITKYALEPINGQFRDWLKNDVVTNKYFSFMDSMIDWNYNVTVDTFNLGDVAAEGLFSQLNTILVGFLSEVFNDAAVKELGLTDGGNDKLQGNLENTLRYVLKKVPSNIEGYDIAAIQANADKLTLEELGVAALKMFFMDWFDKDAPAEAASLEALGAFAAYAAIDKFVLGQANYADWQFGNFSDLIFGADGKMLAKSDAEWLETIYTMGLDVAVYALNHNSNSTDFILTPDQAKAYKDAGWGWEAFADEIVDWGVNYIKGIPAIADEITAERGKLDGFGPFYKVNVVLNKLLPLSLLTGCDDGYFYGDTETLIMDKLFGSIFNLDISGVVDILNVNSNPGNPFNKPLIAAVLDLVTDLLDGIFNYDKTVASEELKADGYTYNKGTVDKFYRITGTYEEEPIPVDPVTDELTFNEGTPVTVDGETIIFGQYTPKGTTGAELKAYTACDVTLSVADDAKVGTGATLTFGGKTYTLVAMGDVTGDGKVTTADAKKALQKTASLITLDELQTFAADATKDGKIKTGDVKQILRFAASLETSIGC